MKMREGRVTRRATAVEEAPTETAQEAMSPAAGGDDAAATVARVGFAPIVRVDAVTREVELCATSEALDSHGTVFDYRASKDAFNRWIGNVREMHERRAVGTRVAVRCDDETHRIFVRIRISRGAQDTWEKVLDGTLRGASIGASNVTWERQQRQVANRERWLNVATRYDLVELSLVDNPSNPDALGLTFVRDAVPDATVLDVVDEAVSSVFPDGLMQPALPGMEGLEPLSGAWDGPVVESRRSDAHGAEAPVAATEALNGHGSAHLPAAEDALHTRLHGVAEAILRGCGCPLCQGALAMLAIATESKDGVERAAADMPDLREAALMRVVGAGLGANTAQLNAMDAGIAELKALVQAAMRQMATTMGELSGRVGHLEEQPLPGGPMARAVEKSHALAARREEQGSAPNREEQYRALESLAGRLRDPQSQVAVAAELIRLQQEG